MHYYILRGVMFKYRINTAGAAGSSVSVKTVNTRVCWLACVKASHVMLLYSAFGQWMQSNGPAHSSCSDC